MNYNAEPIFGEFENKFVQVRNGQYLDIYIDDSDYQVRAEVARQNYGLDILINDPHWIVRRQVAAQGYGLDILINDEEPLVSNIVIEYCKIHPEKPECIKLLKLYNL